MNKKAILLLMFFFSAFHGYSQLSWNVKAGMNFSRISGWRNTDLKPGYQVGAGIDYFFSEHWGIQPSLVLVSKGYKREGEYLNLATGEPLSKSKITENRVYLELPVMLAYRFNVSDNMKLIINGGGYISYGIGGKVKDKITVLEDGSIHNEKYDTFSNRAEKFDTGLGAGATLEFCNKYTIGLIGEWGLKSTLGNDSKNQTYGLNIGYKF